ncbi:hypothetical protein [Salinactinospora qingdaonensis]|uniref:Uncharacterized protein n=1 Tax=Salinactinospora qingdaonensis TaxID=702744 RepID=A0ABP7FBS5_9ACTN
MRALPTPESTPPHDLPEGVALNAVPDWSAMARDWDGVHLTFAGLLSAYHVHLTRQGWTSTLWTWETEQTLWLRDVFTHRREPPPLTDLPTDIPEHDHLHLRATPV